MISDGRDSSFNKQKTINRRMFIFTAAKAVIFLVLWEDYLACKLVIIKNT